MENDLKSHWEEIYLSKPTEERSWFQVHPQAGLSFIEQRNISRDARVIDVGGGDSCLVDALLGRGFTDITVLDISERAINRARQRLGDQADKVRWVVADVLDFQPKDHAYDFWYDRATFHFLLNDEQVHRYASMVRQAVATGGFLLMGTFSENGPEKCSGLSVRRYSQAQMEAVFCPDFHVVYCEKELHTTPSQASQEFLFCGFRKQ